MASPTRDFLSLFDDKISFPMLLAILVVPSLGYVSLCMVRHILFRRIDFRLLIMPTEGGLSP
jgi:hypothetical protein